MTIDDRPIMHSHENMKCPINGIGPEGLNQVLGIKYRLWVNFNP
jgi:hypothetical protein